MTRIVLVVPCFNEAARLDTDAFLAFQPGTFELSYLFVDDGSTDGTGGILDALQTRAPKRVEVLHLETNSGKAEAIRRGFHSALTDDETDAIGFWDADLSTPLDELSRFHHDLQRDEMLDVVLGSRIKLLGRAIERRPSRHYIGRGFATVASMVLSLPVYDTQCGAKLFRVNDGLRAAFEEPFLTRWVFDVEVLARYIVHCTTRGLDFRRRIIELPLFCWRDVAGSKLRTIDGVWAFFGLLKIRRKYITPLRRSGRWPIPPPGKKRLE